MKEHIEYEETDRQLRNRWKMVNQMENKENDKKMKTEEKDEK